MFGWLIKFIRTGVVSDVPAEMDRCLDCGKLYCSDGDFETCARRKQRAAELTAARKEDGASS